jgi:hypothetical protein
MKPPAVVLLPTVLFTLLANANASGVRDDQGDCK